MEDVAEVVKEEEEEEEGGAAACQPDGGEGGNIVGTGTMLPIVVFIEPLIGSNNFTHSTHRATISIRRTIVGLEGVIDAGIKQIEQKDGYNQLACEERRRRTSAKKREEEVDG